MRVVFRTDASTRMGTGHVMRCLTLAEELQSRHATASFICRAHDGHLIGAIEARGFPVATLPLGTTPPDERGDHAAWLGASVDEDAERTLEALRGDAPDWMVVDHYGLDVAWEQRLRPCAGRLAAIDDLPGRVHDCDLLLDQNYADDSDRHRDSVPAACELLLGPRYALVSSEDARRREACPPRGGRVRRLLLYFGGADPSNMTGEALTALSAPELADLQVDLVIGNNHPQRTALEAQGAARPNTCIHATRPHLADLMAAADLAVGAGGITTWERMCLGLPALVVSIAENQRPTCEALGRAGLVDYIGTASSVKAPEIRNALVALLQRPEQVAALGARGRDLVDGRGAGRVADVLAAPSAADRLQTRHRLHAGNQRPDAFDTFTFAWIDRCRADDVLAMRNMPHVRAQMRVQDAIAPAAHRAFLDAYDRLDRYDFVLVDESRGRYVGAFYVTNLSSTPEIGKYIGDPDYLGKGIARKAMERLFAFYRSRAGLRQLTAVTRSDNVKNIALNLALGFTRSGTQRDYTTMVLDL